jgi:protein-disulfide isomerase
MTSETKLFLGIIAGTVALLIGAIWFFSKPAPSFSREELIGKTAQTKGNPDAKTYLVEFSDFQCPACKAAQPTVDDIIKTYGNTILFVYRHFPLDQHLFAEKAAVAAEAAGRQGKFWESVAVLFQNQDKLSDDFFSTQFAQLVQLDKTRYEKDIADPAIAEKIKNDLADGKRFGVNATPTFFLNGKNLTVTSFDELKVLMDNAVKTKDNTQ